MDPVSATIDFILHVDVHLASIVQQYGVWTYAVLVTIIFCETGLVVTPFLPGDSLLFATGALAATTQVLDVGLLFVLLTVAAILGDAVNYWMGANIGTKLFDGRIPYLKQEHLDRTHAFYEKYGGITVILARFFPFMRTFIPFVAGIAAMNRVKFTFYNVIGGAIWVVGLVTAGYFLGSIPWVKENLDKIIWATILIPGVIVLAGAWNARRKAVAS